MIRGMMSGVAGVGGARNDAPTARQQDQKQQARQGNRTSQGARKFAPTDNATAGDRLFSACPA